MRLRYLPANQAYVFTFGEQLIRLAGEPMFYSTRKEAVAMARHYGMTVDKRGLVSPRR